MLDCLPQQQAELVTALEAVPAQQFAYLKSLVAISQQEEGGTGGAGSLKARGWGALTRQGGGQGRQAGE